MEAGLPQGLPMSQIFVTIHTAGLMKMVEARVHGVEGHAFLYDLGCGALEADVNQVVTKLEPWAADCIE